MVLISNIDGGLNTRYNSLNIADSEFSVLRNLISWRHSILSLPGTDPVCRLSIPVTASATIASDGTATINMPIGDGQLSPFQLEVSVGSTVVWTAPVPATGELFPSGSVNYSTGVLTLSGGTPGAEAVATGYVYPLNPVMGIGTWASPVNVGSSEQIIFDNEYAYFYNWQASVQGDALAISRYQGQSDTTAATWSGGSSNQFRFANCAGALWVVNNTFGMAYGTITAVSPGSSTTTITIPSHGLASGNRVWFNEIGGVTGINGQTAMITVTGTNTFTVPLSTTGTYTSGGIAQYLDAHTTSDPGIRYYWDSQPGGTGAGGGFVNYAPPTSDWSVTGDVEYICGARTVLYYGGRLCFLGVYLINSAGTVRYVANGLFYSSIIATELGSPYYTSLSPYGSDGVNAVAFYAFPSGQYGGYLLIGSGAEIASATVWKLEYAVVAIRAGGIWRLYTTDNAVFPFRTTALSVQFGGSGVGSAVALSQFVSIMTKYGIVIANNTTVERIDNPIPDMVGAINVQDNGLDKCICYLDNAMQTIWFTFPSGDSLWNDTSLVYNYIDGTWCVVDEQATCYGTLIPSQALTYGHIWDSLTEPWSSYTWGSGESVAPVGYAMPLPAIGTQNGFVVYRQVEMTGYNNAPTMAITSLSESSLGFIVLEIPNGNLKTGDIIYVTGILGTASVLNDTNMLITAVSGSVFTTNAEGSGLTYLGGGVAATVPTPFLQTKSFAIGQAKQQGTALVNVGLQLRSGEAEFSIYGVGDTSSSSPSQSSVDYPPVQSAFVSSAPPSETGMSDTPGRDYFWYRNQMQVLGYAVGVALTQTLEQRLLVSNNSAPIEINAIYLNLTPSGDMFVV